MNQGTVSLLIVAVRDGGLQRGLQVAQRGQLLARARAHVEHAAVPPAEDAERVESQLERRCGRSGGSQRVGRLREVLLRHERVEQVYVWRPAVQALVTQALSRLLDGQPALLRRHERDRRCVDLGVVGQRGRALRSRECGVTCRWRDEPVNH